MTDHECLSPSGLERLPRDTFVRSVEFHPKLESTQARAMECAAQPDLPLPLLVAATRQTSGRGRGVNRWWAATGALTFSIVLDSNTVDSSDARLSVVTALAIRETLADLYPKGHYQLKWPNDVFLNGRKIGGILLEKPTSVPDRIIVGIGINVNNSVRQAPADIRDRAVALIDAVGRPFMLIAVLRDLLQRLESVWSDYNEGNLQLAETWSPHCRLRGKHVVVLQGTRRAEGTCVGIDDGGHLLLDGPSGLQSIASGTVVIP